MTALGQVLELRRPRAIDVRRLADPWPFLLLGIALMANYTVAVVDLPVFRVGLTPALVAFVCAVAVLLARLVWLHDPRLKLPPISVGLALTAVWILLSFPSVLLSLDPPLSLRLTTWLPFYALLGVIAASYIWTDGLSAARRILLVAWYASVAYAVWGLVVLEAFVQGHDLGQYVASTGARITALTGEANSFAAYLSLTIPIGFALATRRSSSLLLKVTLPLVLAAGLLTFSRGMWLVIAVTMLGFIIAERFRVRPTLRITAYAAAAAMISSILFVQFPPLVGFFGERVQTAVTMAMAGPASRATVVEVGLRALSAPETPTARRAPATPTAPAPTALPEASPALTAPAASAPLAVTAPTAAAPTAPAAMAAPTQPRGPSSLGGAADQAASALLASNPLRLLFGIGQGAPVKDLAELGLSDIADKRGRGQILFLHNLYAQVFVSSGALAFIVFLVLVLYEIWASLRMTRTIATADRSLVFAGVFSLVGVLVMGFSFDMLLTPYLFLALFWNRAIREVQARASMAVRPAVPS